MSTFLLGFELFENEWGKLGKFFSFVLASEVVLLLLLIFSKFISFNFSIFFSKFSVFSFELLFLWEIISLTLLIVLFIFEFNSSSLIFWIILFLLIFNILFICFNSSSLLFPILLLSFLLFKSTLIILLFSRLKDKSFILFNPLFTNNCWLSNIFK